MRHGSTSCPMLGLGTSDVSTSGYSNSAGYLGSSHLPRVRMLKATVTFVMYVRPHSSRLLPSRSGGRISYFYLKNADTIPI
jgi:hypothetical protein